MIGHSKKATLWLALLGLSALPACDGCDPGATPVVSKPPISSASAALPALSAPVQAGPYMPTQKVSLVGRVAAEALAPDGSCPPIDPDGKWKPRRLFVAADDPSAVAPPGMERFCAYDSTDPKASANEAIERSRKASPGLFEKAFPLERDVQNVAASAFPVIDAGFAADAVARFRAAVGVPAPEALAKIELPANRVRVALIDTFPNWAEPSPLPLPTTASLGAAHGYALASLVKTLACDGAAGCATRLSTHLALPDGYYGTKTDLAHAINQAVSAWKADPAGPERLIVHLAVGWEPQAGPAGAASTDPCSVEAGSERRSIDSGAIVLRALKRAVCSGAIVVAAAGNNQGPLLSVSGPTCPAAFEALAQPTNAECGEWLGPKGKVAPPEDSLAYAPLVYAVGAVGYDGAPTPSTRIDGMPRLAANGEQGVGLALPGWAAPKVMSGSSVATAVAAAVASVVWAKNPEWKAAEVMKQLYGSGLPVPTTGAPVLSSFFLAGSSPAAAARVQLCRALGIDSACPPAPSVKLVPIAVGGGADPVPLHHGTATLITVAPSTAPSHLVVPQPITVCPECALGLPMPPESLAELFGTIKSLPPGEYITDTRLQVLYETLPPGTYGIALPNLHVGDSFDVEVTLAGSVVRAAQLTWTLMPSARPVTQQILIAR